MNRQLVSTLLLTAGFLGAYFVLRQLPNETCGLFHYEVTEVTADGLEFCKGDAGSFIDLVRLPFPINIQLNQASPLIPGQPTAVALSLLGPGGKLILPHHLTRSHTELLHLFLVDESLSDYQHIHPAPLGLSGEWVFDFTPKQAGPYQLYAQFVHAKTRRTLMAQACLPSLLGGGCFFVSSAASVHEGHGVSVGLSVKKGALVPGSPSELVFSITPLTDQLLALEPLMGAYAHAVVFAPQYTGMAHLHPLADSRVSSSAAQLRFLFQPSFLGVHRLWLQFKHQGESVYLPFDIEVTED